MKKLMVFILATVMVAGVFGTALAVDSGNLDATGGVSNVFWTPSFSTADSGASLYVLTGTILDITATGNNESATTLYAIANSATDAAGNLVRAQLITDSNISGSTPIGGAQLVSGTSTTVIVYVRASSLDRVNDQPESGNTLMAVNGLSGAVYWETGIPCTGFGLRSSDLSIFGGADTGVTFHSTAPVTIDTSSYISDALGGATIFGVSGASPTANNSNGGTDPGSGVSIWAIDADTGLFTTNTGGNSNITGFQFTPGGPGSGVSVVHAAPVVSGTSLFIIGFGGQNVSTGNTIYAFLKDNLLAGVSSEATINDKNGDLSDQWMPTPCVTGGSIFVVDNDGGVSVFDTMTLTQLTTNWIFGEKLITGVTAGPVTDGTYIVFSGTTRVRCARVSDLSVAESVDGGVSKQWEFAFGPNAQIWGTPAISGSGTTNYVWVTVNTSAAAGGVPTNSTTYRFTLNDTYQGARQTAETHGNEIYASPIIVDDDLWTVTYDPTVEKSTATGASGVTYWTQFKFDAAKTGANIYTPSAAAAAAAAAAYVPGSSGGCFISTIK